MKLIKQENLSRHEKISGVRLFRNDIDKIIEAYSKEGYSLSIYDDEYKYDSLNDYIENHGYKVKKLTLLFRKTEEDSIVVSTFILVGNTVTISTDSGINPFTVVFEHLNKRKPFTRYFLWQNNPMLLFFIYFFIVIMFATPIYTYKKTDISENFSNPMIFIYLSFALIGVYLLLSILLQKYYLGINLEKEYKTGLNKYRSKIILSVIVAIITFILTKLGDWVFN